ncbi:28S ribosomal protein S21, mitochondrial [Tetranychus urticae]|uniref:28S ribosomal protein S21, mitochondrial n=1 Tax=Tetranychus urticae TaxID=32264 RepID=T1K8W3_TETUR|nr:28S ribosomal protein S21, mitochondrial [Tetranychus urticae]
MRHIKFLGRTVLVKDGKIEAAFKIMNRVLASEGCFENFRRNQRYEKPYLARRRFNFERCKAIYEEDMARKISFIMRKNRVEPYPGRT